MKIKVSATSANLACGFDSFGIALDLFNTFSFLPLDENEIVINNYRNTQANKSNLIASSFYTTLDILGKKSFGVEIKNTSDVPLSRGLGSSATCIVASVTAAYELAGIAAKKDEIFQIAAKIEGHADNVAPAIFGGGTIAYKEGERFLHATFEVDEKYNFCAIIPNFTLPTAKARAALPESYNIKDVVFNISRAAILPLAFERGDDELLACALEDKIHQPYRSPLIKNYERVEGICRDCKYIASYLSGAGPTIMALGNQSSDFERLKTEIAKMDARYTVMTLKIARDAASIL